jgi:hypothetical protein
MVSDSRAGRLARDTAGTLPLAPVTPDACVRSCTLCFPLQCSLRCRPLAPCASWTTVSDVSKSALLRGSLGVPLTPEIEVCLLFFVRDPICYV